jgi:hypothetical protein
MMRRSGSGLEGIDLLHRIAIRNDSDTHSLIISTSTRFLISPASSYRLPISLSCIASHLVCLLEALAGAGTIPQFPNLS